MKADHCRKLRAMGDKLAGVYTRKAQEQGDQSHGITFDLEDIEIFSELTAGVTLLKSNGQRVFIRMEWVAIKVKGVEVGGEWHWRTMRYDHIYGMQRMFNRMFEIEQQNFANNTKPIPGLPKRSDGDPQDGTVEHNELSPVPHGVGEPGVVHPDGDGEQQHADHGEGDEDR